VESETFDAPDYEVKWAALRATTAAKTDDFASDTVFLVGEGETDEGGGVEILVGAGENVSR
jgi:hypothetical protein